LFVDRVLLRRLEEGRVDCCLIGATALAVHGFVRATADVDLLTLDERVLTAGFWRSINVELRQGEWDDPLAGTVRHGDTDLVVGRGYAARTALDSAVPNAALGLRVATPLGLVLLKLEAGSALDRMDIVELIAAQRTLNGAAWVAGLPAHLPRLSAGAQAAWMAVSLQTVPGQRD